MHDDEQLAALQDAMLVAMHEATHGAEARARIAPAVADPQLRSWVASWEERPLDVATRLVKKWGRRRG